MNSGALSVKPRSRFRGKSAGVDVRGSGGDASGARGAGAGGDFGSGVRGAGAGGDFGSGVREEEEALEGDDGADASAGKATTCDEELVLPLLRLDRSPSEGSDPPREGLRG